MAASRKFGDDPTYIPEISGGGPSTLPSLQFSRHIILAGMDLTTHLMGDVDRLNGQGTETRVIHSVNFLQHLAPLGAPPQSPWDERGLLPTPRALQWL